MFSVVPNMVLLIGTCLLINSFVNDIKNDLPHLEVNGPSNGVDRQNEMTKWFGNIVQTHSDTKQLSGYRDTDNVNQAIKIIVSLQMCQ